MKDCPHDCNEKGYIWQMKPHCRCFSCYDFFPCPVHRPGEKYVSFDEQVAKLNQHGRRVAKVKRREKKDGN
jgi:hypothetical protein